MISKQIFGRLGNFSSRTIFGAAALARVSQDEADAAIELAISYGVNHVDTAASYGESETRIGSWIDRHEKQFFLATKTEKRTAAEARKDLHRSLQRLKVDQVDLLQLHNLVDPDQWDIAMGPGGALEAAIEAREQGLVRGIGVTGHGLTVAEMHLKSIELFDFDSVLLPFSYILMKNEVYRSHFERLMEACHARNIAVQTIKSIARAPWGARPQTCATWYEPLQEQEDIDLAVHWVLGHNGMFLNTVGDVHLLPLVLKSADTFTTIPDEVQMQTLVERVSALPLFE